MLNNPFVYTFSIVIVCSFALSGIYIAAVRGFKPPITYMLLYRFAGALLAAVNIVQTWRSILCKPYIRRFRGRYCGTPSMS